MNFPSQIRRPPVVKELNSIDLIGLAHVDLGWEENIEKKYLLRAEFIIFCKYLKLILVSSSSST